jgi:hypothetical protein
MAVKFEKAIAILDLLLEGKTPKQIVYELDVPVSQVTEAKQKFPLLAVLRPKESR